MLFKIKKIYILGLIIFMAVGLYCPFVNAQTLVPVIRLVKNGITDDVRGSVLIKKDENAAGSLGVGIQLEDGTTLTNRADSPANGSTPANINVSGTGMALWLRIVSPHYQGSERAPYLWEHKVWENGASIDNAMNYVLGYWDGRYDIYYYIDAGSSGYGDVGQLTS